MQKRSIIRRSTILPTEVMAPYWPNTMDLVAADLSPRGMYLISEEMPTVGEFVFCTFSLRRGEPEYRLLSRVNRINWHRRKTDRIRPGFGVEFVGVAAEQYQRISASLIGMPPPIPTRQRKNRQAVPDIRIPKVQVPRISSVTPKTPSVPTPSASRSDLLRPSDLRFSVPRPSGIRPPVPTPSVPVPSTMTSMTPPTLPRPSGVALTFAFERPKIIV